MFYKLNRKPKAKKVQPASSTSFSSVLPPPNIQHSRSSVGSVQQITSSISHSPTSPALSDGSPNSNGMQHMKDPMTAYRQSPQQPVIAEVEANVVAKPQLIIGIDFGTTNSGVAFAWATGLETKEDIISEWPGLGNMTKFKIPSVLYYDSTGKIVGWGSDSQACTNMSGQPRPGITKVEWFKLHLQRNYKSYINPNRLPSLPFGKSEIEVVADYLGCLRDAMVKELHKKLGDIFVREEKNIKYFLTVPAIWDDAGKNATRQAAVLAGFVDDISDRRLSLITEPEAAAVFCAKRGVMELRRGDSFLIVDCGGGTVDLIAYEVEDEDPFTVRECTSGTGDSCGSTAIDVNFKHIVDARLDRIRGLDEKQEKKIKDKIRRRCREDFERIKIGFGNKSEIDWSIDVGMEVDFEEANIIEGNIIFSNDDILLAYNPIVRRIVELVRDQITAVQAQNKFLKAILVVGGFGASQYLYDQLRLQVPPQYSNKVLRPMDSVAAIVRGAVVTGIYERVLVSRVSRKHYLMATLSPFKPGIHPEAYKVLSVDGGFRCKNTRQIFVQKGQRLKIGQTIKISFFRQVPVGSSLIFEDRLYSCDEDVCPEFITDPSVQVMVVLSSDLTTIPTDLFQTHTSEDGVVFYKIFFDVLLTLDGGNEMRAELMFSNKIIGHVRSKFN
ncbi:hypothetical protein V1511DRAFT_455245 [Dipodascopsis uninucleata]